MRTVGLVGAFAIAVLGAVAGCKPEVGDECTISTDCSITGDRLCDTSQPGGYCTIFNCDATSCPEESVCVEFHPSSTRFARRFCVRVCDAPSECRPGYVCVAPTERDGVVISSDPQSGKVCLP